MVWLSMFEIFNVLTDADAWDCTGRDGEREEGEGGGEKEGGGERGGRWELYKHRTGVCAVKVDPGSFPVPLDKNKNKCSWLG